MDRTELLEGNVSTRESTGLLKISPWMSPPTSQSHYGSNPTQRLSSPDPEPPTNLSPHPVAFLSSLSLQVCPLPHIHTATTRPSSSFTTHLEKHTASSLVSLRSFLPLQSTLHTSEIPFHGSYHSSNKTKLWSARPCVL